MAYLKDTLKSGDIRKLYLFYGNEDYLKDSCRYQVRAAVLNPGDTINVNVYDSDNLDLSSMIEQAGTLPFFAPHRLIIAKNTGFFILLPPHHRFTSIYLVASIMHDNRIFVNLWRIHMQV